MCKEIKAVEIANIMAGYFRSLYGENMDSVYLYEDNFDYDGEKAEFSVAAIVNGEQYDLQRKIEQICDPIRKLSLENYAKFSFTVVPKHEFEEHKNEWIAYRHIAKGKKIV